MKFVLEADGANEYEGWELDNIYINVERQAGISKRLSQRDTAEGNLSANITSLNAQSFPYIFSNLNIAYQQAAITTLNTSNFTVFEDGVEQTDLFEVIPPSSGSGSRLVDVVFIMDNSGSMDDEQSAVRNNVIAFVDALSASGVDYALGLCRYGQGANSGAPIIEDGGVLTQDRTYFKDDVWMRNTTDGDTEPAFSAIVDSLNQFVFRPGSQKIIILITDERPNQSSITQQQAKAALANASASLYTLTTSELFSQYDEIYGGAQQYQDNEGSDIATALAVALDENYSAEQNGSIDFGEDYDYFKIEVPVGGSLSITSVSGFDTYGYLYDGCGNQLTDDDDSGDGDQFLITRNVDPGVYYVIVSAYSSSTTGAYTVVINHTPDTSSSSYGTACSPSSSSSSSSSSSVAPDVVIPGNRYLITSSFEDILNDISAQLSATYIVKYRTLNNQLDGQVRTVLIRVAHSGEVVEVSATYTPGAAPVITRTSDTIAYEAQAWPEDQEFVIVADITDSVTPFVQSAKLYYKLLGATSYTAVPMSNTQGTLWSANIPAGFAKQPAVAYYLSATDGQSTVTLPSSNAQTHPFMIAILPNVAPSISNVLHNVQGVGADIGVSALIEDTTNRLDETVLYYRQRGALTYTAAQMTASQTQSNLFTASIPAASVTTSGIEYYLYAKDDYGSTATYGTPDAPMFISIGALIQGRVVDGYTGVGLSGALVNIWGDYNGSYTTDASGNYRFGPLQPGNYTLRATMQGYTDHVQNVSLQGTNVTSNFTLIPQATAQDYSVVLSWGAAPRDLDSHLYIPNGTSTCGHVYYGSQGGRDTFPFAQLDVDDTSSYGPETITISALQRGTYQYWVHQFSSDGDMAASQAVVQIYKGGVLVKTFNVPTALTGMKAWHVFDLDSRGKIILPHKNQTTIELLSFLDNREYNKKY